ncbi:hypothetical protein ACTXT7_007249 [Hymenolepis weldensis]
MEQNEVKPEEKFLIPLNAMFTVIPACFKLKKLQILIFIIARTYDASMSSIPIKLIRTATKAEHLTIIMMLDEFKEELRQF